MRSKPYAVRVEGFKDYIYIMKLNALHAILLYANNTIAEKCEVQKELKNDGEYKTYFIFDNRKVYLKEFQLAYQESYSPIRWDIKK